MNEDQVLSGLLQSIAKRVFVAKYEGNTSGSWNSYDQILSLRTTTGKQPRLQQQ
jgi:hypothetical protein